MKIGIVGSGISGLTAAYYLNKAGHDIYVFEANDYVGGHTHTIPVETSSGKYNIDTGFIVFNHRTYPNFVKLLQECNVSSQPTNMSFSVFAPDKNIQYSGESLNGLFADRKNIFNSTFYKLLYEILRFQTLAKEIVAHTDTTLTIHQFLKKNKLSDNFSELYFYPLVSALWSTALRDISNMPIYFVAMFFNNHGLLKAIPDLPWQVIKGGSFSYIKKLTQDFADKIYINTPVIKIARRTDGCKLWSPKGELGIFDKIIVATHSDQALKLLAEPSSLEFEILSKFTYSENEVVLHTDSNILPPNKRAWASWNYWVNPDANHNAVLTYHMNRLQSISAPEEFCVSLNATRHIQPEKIIQTFNYAHPQYTVESLSAQSRQSELNNHSGSIYYCGAYWGFGFHEDGVKSAVNVFKNGVFV
ncbi:MAG: FAD-dependent oxidoreductase [Gammaproteobacteria bacterium]|nr:FAD-dependent oxidoreductase [Gammaproteobacteria bacterium]